MLACILILYVYSLKFDFSPIWRVRECVQYFPWQFILYHEFLSLFMLLFANVSFNASQEHFVLVFYQISKPHAVLYVRFYYVTGHLQMSPYFDGVSLLCFPPCCHVLLEKERRESNLSGGRCFNISLRILFRPGAGFFLCLG